MKSNLRRLAMLMLVALLMPAKLAFAEPDGFKQLSAQWWQWALSSPLATNPVADTTGEYCMVGQKGSMWFLAGTFGGAATRTCDVPAATELFFPVVNYIYFSSPNVCGQGSEDFSVKEMRGWIDDWFEEQTISISVEVDGREVKPVHHVVSEPFSVALPESNVFDAACSAYGGHPAGVFSPAVDRGYYVRLNPLPQGEHTIHIGAEVAGGYGDFTVDVTYNLTVVPVLKK